VDFKEIITVTSPVCWALLLFLMAPSLPLLCPVLENTVSFLKQMWAIARACCCRTLSLGDKEPSTGAWDQAALAPW